MQPLTELGVMFNLQKGMVLFHQLRSPWFARHLTQRTDLPPPADSMIFMTFGMGHPAISLAILVSGFSSDNWGWLLFMICLVMLYVPIFLAGVVLYARFLTTDIFPHFDNVQQIELVRGAQLLAMSAAFAFLSFILLFIEPIPGAIIYTIPFAIFAGVLFAFTILHSTVIIVRRLATFHRGWQ